IAVMVMFEGAVNCALMFKLTVTARGEFVARGEIRFTVPACKPGPRVLPGLTLTATLPGVVPLVGFRLIHPALVLAVNGMEFVPLVTGRFCGGGTALFKM